MINNCLLTNNFTRINFKARIKPTDPKESQNPTLVYKQERMKFENEVDQKDLSQIEKKKLHNAIRNYVIKMHPHDGCLEPNLDINTKRNFNKINRTGFSPSISQSIKRLYDKENVHIGQVYRAAGQNFMNIMGRRIKELLGQLSLIKENSEDFAKHIVEANNFFANGIEVEINLESGKLHEIAKSNESVIFIFNHPNYPTDVFSINTFISELYKTYLAEGKGAICPHPKLLNLDRSAMNPKEYSDLLTQTSVVYIDANPIPSTERSAVNSKIMAEVEENFVKNKNNIFIAPEGPRRLLSDLPLSYRFQCGVARIVQRATNQKERVKVVPVGIYAEGLKSAMHIGNPVYFEKQDDMIKISKGNITDQITSKQSNSFYSELAKLEEGQSLPLSYMKKPLEGIDKASRKTLSRLIAGSLSANLDICISKAEETFIQNFKKLPK